MSWLLFLDESGHDHKSMPYEVRGGIAIHASKLWGFIDTLKQLEQSIFGTRLMDFGVELKGANLLRSRCIRWSKQSDPMDDQLCRKHALAFLNCPHHNHLPTRDQFTAYGQACLNLVEKVFTKLSDYDAYVFAVFIPRKVTAQYEPDTILRKDHRYLFERYFYFLEEQNETGLIVMDETEKQNDRRFLRRMERYFTHTSEGRLRTSRIMPIPMFVQSDMSEGVQVADLAIYCLNHGWRLHSMTEPKLEDIEPFAWLLEKRFWKGDITHGNERYTTYSTVYVPELVSANRDISA